MRKMNYPIAAVVYILCFLIQSTILWRYPILGYSANLLLCLTVTFTNLYVREYALVYGLAFGVLFDIATQQLVGAQTISFVAVYLLIRLFGRNFNPEQVLPELFFSVGATMVNGVMVWLVYAIGGMPMSFVTVLASLPPLILVNAITVFVLHLIFVRSIIRYSRDRKFNGETYP